MSSGVAGPVADGFVDGVLEGLVAGGDGDDLGAEHTHALDVGPLTADVEGAHVDAAGQAHQGAHGGRGYAVLPGAGFGDDAALAEVARQQHLADGVVDFVCAGVVQVFTLQVDVGADVLAEAAGVVEGGRAADVVAQQGAVLALKVGTGEHVGVAGLQPADAGVQDLGNEGTAVGGRRSRGRRG